MGNINRLDSFTSNRIAAGEVVERPASVIKELVENSIDAASTCITIEIRGGGIEYIRVTDNGEGIDENDVLIAFERHATSKIAKPQDLDSIETLGFRGEALSSIAAVSHVELRSRRIGAESGRQVAIAGGELKSNKQAGCPEGTTIICEHLFFNTPARLKFLKADSTEAGYVGDYILRMILSRPDISFKYINNGKTFYHSTGEGDLLTAIFAVYGKDFTKSLVKIEYEGEGIKIFGYASKSDASKSNRSFQSFFVNGRYVRSIILSSALQAGYGSRMMVGKFPACVINISVAFDQVDVNIHPNKLEVRFGNEGAAMSAITKGVERAFAGYNTIDWIYKPKQTPLDKEELTQVSAFKSSYSEDKQAKKEMEANEIAKPSEPNEIKQSEKEKEIDIWKDTLQTLKKEHFIDKAQKEEAIAPQAIDDSQLRTFTIGKQPVKMELHEGFVPFEPLKEPMTIIGQAFACYIIVQQGEGLYIIDQHAAHERLIYDNLMQSVKIEATQKLLIASELILEPMEEAILIENQHQLYEFGFEFTVENNLVSITGVPASWGESEPSDFLREAVNQLMILGKSSAAELKREKLIQCACKHAIKANDPLNNLQIEQILSRFDSAEQLNCPHGRPIVIRMAKKEFEKMFKRV